MLLTTVSFISDVFVATGLIFVVMFIACALPGLALLAVYAILKFFGAN